VENQFTVGAMLASSWTKEQWKVITTLAITHFCNGLCVSLQAPFYPNEAEKKGASATEYGLVFGIFELTVFIVSPIIGKYLPKIGVSKAFSGGISITGSMCVAFGLLNKIDDCRTFIALSFLIRIFEACGNSAFLSSSFTLVAQMFPSSVSTVFGLVEMSFGIGMILGPTVGGALYEVGGFTIPFAVLGAVLIVQAIISTQTLPKIKQECSSNDDSMSNYGILQAIQIPSILLAIFSVFSASIAVGALQATLERHLDQFHLSPMHVGMFFMLYGGAYALLNPFWGWMADKVSSKLVIFIGAFLLGLGFLLIGPVPGIGLQTTYPLCIVSVIIAGIGLGAQLVAAFSEAQRSAVTEGFPDNLSTYAMISSLWTSSFALGAFVGPTASGALYDTVGFPWSTLFTVGWNAAVCAATICVWLNVRLCKRNTGYQYDKLEGGNYDHEPNGKETDKLIDEVQNNRMINSKESYQIIEY